MHKRLPIGGHTTVIERPSAEGEIVQYPVIMGQEYRIDDPLPLFKNCLLLFIKNFE